MKSKYLHHSRRLFKVTVPLIRKPRTEEEKCRGLLTTKKSKNKNQTHSCRKMKYQKEMKDIFIIETEQERIQDIAQLQSELEIPQDWNGQTGLSHVTEARQMMTRPALGKAHMLGSHALTKVVVSGCGIIEGSNRRK